MTLLFYNCALSLKCVELAFIILYVAIRMHVPFKHLLQFTVEGRENLEMT